jgi:hypothetical protein
MSLFLCAVKVLHHQDGAEMTISGDAKNRIFTTGAFCGIYPDLIHSESLPDVKTNLLSKVTTQQCQ